MMHTTKLDSPLVGSSRKKIQSEAECLFQTALGVLFLSAFRADVFMWDLGVIFAGICTLYILCISLVISSEHTRAMLQLFVQVSYFVCMWQNLRIRKPIR